MIYVLILKNAQIVAKSVYSGNDTESSRIITVEATKNPGLTFQQVAQPVFDAAVLPPTPPSLEDRVTALEGTVTAVAAQVNVPVTLPVNTVAQGVTP